jgi:arylsulfatase A-like enzyme
MFAWAGCGSAPERWVPVHRLVDAAYRHDPGPQLDGLQGRTSQPLRTAAIANDIRPVLKAHDMAVAHLRDVARPPDGRTTVDLPLERWFPVGAHVWIAPSYNPGPGWIDLPSSQARVQAGVTPLELILEKPPQRKRIHLAARVYRIPESPRTRYVTAPIDIPPTGRLRFAMGELAPATQQGPVHFRVEACRDESCVPVFEETLDPAAAGGENWLERAVPLDAVPGRHSLRFETEYRGDVEGGFSLPVWANPTVLAPEAREPPGPNLVLLSIDTLRADHLGVYGYDRDTSPFLDEVLAPAGTVFDAYVSAATTTGPSHMTMFTSLPPMVHGANRGLDTLTISTTTLAETLRGAGFANAAFTENGPIAHARGFGRGFDEFIENKNPIYMEPRGQIETVFAQARRFMLKHRDERFFLFLHTFQVHAPYEPLPEYRDLFTEEIRSRGPAVVRDGRSVEELVADYDREIRYVDDQLRELYGWMRERGFHDNTVLVVTSDHGEQFNEHGRLGHDCPPYQELAHVPLILHGPGIAAGRRVSPLLGQIDLMPTLLDLLGVEAPAQIQGTSFAAAASGQSPPEIARPLFTSGWDGTGPSGEPFLAIRQGDHKLLRIPSPKGDQYRFFDLAVDPGETRSLGIVDSRAATLLQAMKRHERDSRELRAQLRQGAPEDHAKEAPFDPEREEQLRSLGYIE